MNKEAIQKIEELTKANLLVVGGRQYADKELHPVMDPRPVPLELNSLQGLVDYIKSPVDKLEAANLVIHVVSHDRVDLYSGLGADWKQRDHLISVTRKNHGEGFQFERELDAEKFVIALQANFVRTENLGKVLKVAGNMRSEQSIGVQDDGVSQQVEVKTGIALLARADVPNPVSLAPFRTFIEIDQPESEFVFRVHQKNGETPKCSLHTADGGRWKIEAIQKIAEFLRDHIKSVSIIA